MSRPVLVERPSSWERWKGDPAIRNSELLSALIPDFMAVMFVPSCLAPIPGLGVVDASGESDEEIAAKLVEKVRKLIEEGKGRKLIRFMKREGADTLVFDALCFDDEGRKYVIKEIAVKVIRC